MFYRNAIIHLRKWSKKTNRKPLILRGARQVGKTTLVNQFSLEFGQYIYLNLEEKEEKRPFETYTNVDTLLQNIFFLKNKKINSKKKTLIFIDEIQEVPNAINILRYFYEKYPNIHVIAAGSLLEMLFNNKISAPVGRVEYLALKPVSFPEFLGAIGESAALDQLQKVPLTDFAQPKLMKLFQTYAIIGGMPEVVAHYAKHRDFTALGDIFDSLLTSYLDDIEKYAKTNAQVERIRHTIRASFSLGGTRIKYAGFGNSNYNSREMKEAFQLLEQAFLLHLIYPTSNFRLPLLENRKKSPKLQLLDTGMMNYFSEIQKEIINTPMIDKVQQGRIVEHLVGQELLASKYKVLYKPSFFVREKKTSQAEVDYIYTYNGLIIPIEVKSGKAGKLKSLHIFLDNAPHNVAVRFYAGKMEISQHSLPSGKSYKLLNLPYFAVSQIEKYLEMYVAI